MSKEVIKKNSWQSLSTHSTDLYDLVEMMQKLDARQLKKAKVILQTFRTRKPTPFRGGMSERSNTEYHE